MPLIFWEKNLVLVFLHGIMYGGVMLPTNTVWNFCAIVLSDEKPETGVQTVIPSRKIDFFVPCTNTWATDLKITCLSFLCSYLTGKHIWNGSWFKKFLQLNQIQTVIPSRNSVTAFKLAWNVRICINKKKKLWRWKAHYLRLSWHP